MRPDGSQMPAMSRIEPFGLCGKVWSAGEPSGFIYLNAIWSFDWRSVRTASSA